MGALTDEPIMIDFDAAARYGKRLNVKGCNVEFGHVHERVAKFSNDWLGCSKLEYWFQQKLKNSLSAAPKGRHA